MANILLTGSTGMVGKGVLLECIKSDQIKNVTLINRTTVGLQDPKIKEIIVRDFTEIETIKEQLENINACFHCMGVSSMGLSEEQYSKLTYGITKTLADICFEMNPKMTFNYVSGTGTYSTEKGSQMWARVKGKTENYILNKGFEKAYMFRPGIIIPENGIKSRTRLYNVIYIILRPLFPLLKKMKSVTTTTKVGMAMINSVVGPPMNIVHLENKHINELAGEK